MDRTSPQDGKARAMTLTKAYFLGAIGIGVFFAGHIFAMLAHADASWNCDLLGYFALSWVPLSLVAIFGFIKRPMYCLSPVSYIAYFLTNYFTSPENSFYAEFDPWGIACVIFGVFYLALNITYLAHEFKREPRSSSAVTGMPRGAK